MSKTFLFFLVLIYAAILVYLKPWTGFSSHKVLEEAVPAYLAFIVLGGLLVCCIEWAVNTTNQNKTKQVFLFLNGLYLLFGCALAHFYWTFWIFREPSFVDKIKSTAMPFVFGVLLPVGLFYHFLKNKKS